MLVNIPNKPLKLFYCWIDYRNYSKLINLKVTLKVNSSCICLRYTLVTITGVKLTNVIKHNTCCCSALIIYNFVIFKHRYTSCFQNKFTRRHSCLWKQFGHEIVYSKQTAPRPNVAVEFNGLRNILKTKLILKLV